MVFNSSEWAKTFDAKTRSAFFLIFLSDFSFKNPLNVLILFLLESFAKFLAGSIPNIFLNFKSLKGLMATPSLLPTSKIYDFYGFNLNSLIYLFAAFSKWFLKVLDVDDKYK